MNWDIEQLVTENLRRVHASVYYDQGIFDSEIERIWKRVWLYVGHESEVPLVGDYVAKLLATEPVVLSRSEQGLHVLVNRCPHRGNTVCQHDHGNSNTFRCAYHGWSFANSGELIGATYAKSYGPEFDKSSFDMAQLPNVESYRGFVFARFVSDGPTLIEQLGGAREYIDHFVDLAPDGRVDLSGGVLRVSFDANWKMPLENAVDGYHAVFLHRSVISMGQRDASTDSEGVPSSSSNPRIGRRSRPEVVTRDLGNGNAMLDFSEANQLSGVTNESAAGLFPLPAPDDDARSYRDAMAARLGKDRAREVMERGLSNVVVFPNLALVLQDVRTIVPLGPSRTIVEQRPALLAGAPDSMNAARVHQEVNSYGPSGMVGADDTDVYERNQRGFDGRMNEWVVLERGGDSEVADGSMLRGEGSGETSQRAIWREYRRLMTLEPGATSPVEVRR